MTETLLQIPLAQLRESELNPRKRFDSANLVDLAKSLETHGVITALVARQVSNGGSPKYELAAGHRRFRAAQMAGLETVPVRVLPLDDQAFLEVLTIENLQREDLHPLEEAQSFADLVRHASYDAARIAARIHRNTSYVYDRLTLLQLIPAAQQLFLQGKIPVTHAILLARLAAERQEQAIDPAHAPAGEGLYQLDHGLFDREEGADEADPYRRLKPVSEKEFRRWIDKHVRFELDDKHAPTLFPETLHTVGEAIQEREKVIHITTEHHVLPEAKADGQRTWSRNSWKRADGNPDPYGWRDTGKPTKTCEHSVMGIIVVGPGRSEAFRVCTAKKECKTHWREEMAAAARDKNDPSQESAKERQTKEQEKWKREEDVRREEKRRWEKAMPALVEAIALKLSTAKTDTASPAGLLVISECSPFRKEQWMSRFAAERTADGVVRFAAFLVLGQKAMDQWRGPSELPKLAKQFGIDVATIVRRENGEISHLHGIGAAPKKPRAKKKAKAKK